MKEIKLFNRYSLWAQLINFPHKQLPMTSDNLLEVGDFILYQDECKIDLARVDKVYRKTVSIEFPDGIHLRVDRKTDGNMAYGKGKPNPFAIMTVIPKNYRVRERG